MSKNILNKLLVLIMFASVLADNFRLKVPETSSTFIKVKVIQGNHNTEVPYSTRKPRQIYYPPQQQLIYYSPYESSIYQPQPITYASQYQHPVSFYHSGTNSYNPAIPYINQMIPQEYSHIPCSLDSSKNAYVCTLSKTEMINPDHEQTTGVYPMPLVESSDPKIMEIERVHKYDPDKKEELQALLKMFNNSKMKTEMTTTEMTSTSVDSTSITAEQKSSV